MRRDLRWRLSVRPTFVAAAVVMVPIAHGSTTVFMDAFDPALAVDLIERHQITSAGGPPAILQAMFAAPSSPTSSTSATPRRWC